MGLGCVVLAAVFAAGASTEVAKVDSSNYDLFLELAAQEEQWVLVDFFAPWCGHCKRLNPVLDEFVANTPGVRVAKVDATVEKALAEAHDVDGYPTLRFRAVGSTEFRDYRGARDARGLGQLDARLRGAAISEVEDLDAGLSALTAAFPPPVFVAAADVDPAVAKAFESAAESLYHMATFARLTRPSDALRPGAVAVVEAGEWAHEFAPADDYEKALKKFVKTHNAPLFSDLGPGNFRKLGATRMIVAAIVDPKAEVAASGCANVARAAARSAAPDVRDAFAFGALDGRKWAEYVATFAVAPADLPKILVIDLERDRYYDGFAPPDLPPDAATDAAARDAASADALVAFLREVLRGDHAPRLLGWRGFPDRAARFWKANSTFCPAALGLLALGLFLINHLFADDDDAPKPRAKRD